MSSVAVDTKPVDQPSSNTAKTERSRAIWWTVETLALCLWLGGLIVIGAVVAPVAFEAMRSAHALTGNVTLQNQMAGAVVGGSFKALNALALFCGGVLVFRCILPILGLTDVHSSRGNTIWIWITGYLIAWAVLIIQSSYLFPAMDTAQAIGNMAKFDSMHHLYVDLTYVQMIALIAVAYSLNLERARMVKS